MLVFGLNVLKEIDLKRVKKVYCARNDVINLLEEKHLPFELKSRKELDKMVKGNHQGLVIEIKDYAYYTLNDITGNFVLILDHLEDPHNFGAIIRTACAAGIKEIIIPKDRSVKITPTVAKVSAGTIEKVKIIMVNNITEAIKKLKKEGFYVYASDMDGTDYREVKYNEKKVLVIGNEGKGLHRLVKENCDEVIKIPIINNVESLNASVAAGILIFGMRD